MCQNAAATRRRLTAIDTAEDEEGQQMLDSKSAPHLVLGMPSNAAVGDAGLYFALASKGVRNNPEAAFSIEDLTTALSQIESTKSGAHSWYQVPCDTSLFHPPQAGRPLDRQVEHWLQQVGKDDLAQDGDRAAHGNLEASLDALLSHRWEDAVILAREVLRLTDREDLRDEALNLMACSQCMLGEPEKALASLQHAVKGDWNLGLQTNLALVATDQDPGVAVQQVRFLIESARSGEDALASALNAIALWQTTQEKKHGEDEDLHEALPASTVDALYALAARPDLNEVDLFQLALFLIEEDATRFARSGVVEKHSKLQPATKRVIQSRAEDYPTYIVSLIEEGAIKQHAGLQKRHAPEWLEERAETAIHLLLDLMRGEETRMVGVGLAMEVLNKGLDCGSLARINLRASVSFHLSTELDEGQVPKEHFIDMMLEAQRAVETRSYADDAAAASELHEPLSELVRVSCDTLAAVYHDFYAVQLAEVAPAAANINYAMGGFMRRMRTDKQAVSSISRQIVEFTNDAQRTMPKLQQLAKDPELRAALGQLSSNLAFIEGALAKYR